jgi:uncharacterized protein
MVRLVPLLLVLAVVLPAEAGKPRPSLPRSALGVPMVRQPFTFDCGAASLKSIAAYWGAYGGSLRQLYKITNTRKSYGTLPEDILRAARRLGLKATLREHCALRDLERSLARKEPVLIQLQAWREAGTLPHAWRDRWDDGHYAVVIGMDRKNVYFMDPSSGQRHSPEKTVRYSWVPRREFLERWHEVDGEGSKIHHAHHPAFFISGEEAHPYPRNVLLKGSRAIEVPVRTLERMR